MEEIHVPGRKLPEDPVVAAEESDVLFVQGRKKRWVDEGEVGEHENVEDL